jgi:ElaA protein
VDLIWRDAVFADLTGATVYAILALRARVFVVEQTCAYDDLDGLDLAARHMWAEDGGRVVAYLRVLPAGVKYAELSIGRVVVDRAYRAHGLGRDLMVRGLALAGAVPVRIAAQAHLERFYGDLGFRRVSDVYDEDGIPHIEMLRS